MGLGAIRAAASPVFRLSDVVIVSSYPGQAGIVIVPCAIHVAFVSCQIFHGQAPGSYAISEIVYGLLVNWYWGPSLQPNNSWSPIFTL